ncbi:UDP-N-acetylmuramoyl-tripeptide--D-alanyl-D-alanine ligase [Treponema zuelzerae]|uniref:UDP-N-acetylmuramoyl-tripeptide--D-alanyl-D-alanine ligase n=1 Tax=Teretinema zuelzerae TaxID=156 RepID=A0AAE3EER1_9SPIR|nr:UDP-N-acetylmuramoyl-tripeptide--D-alanyl-D-alanine ligase [Teretinema zuelzerae]MCD1653255.1 UDP-N-acetylmuramoyl-tripeptide--D-alanyl-D-alanine ligase [Teretinema zuelzerae]
MADSELLLTIPELVDAVDGTCLCNFSPVNGFSSVATDSRKVVTGSLFVPLIGEFQDGHTYITRALEAGASVVLVDSAHSDGCASVFSSLGKQYGACIVSVEHTLAALQRAAAAYVAKFPGLLKIAVTGSSGKTTTKELLGSIFSVTRKVVMNEGNLNSETGLPLSVFKIKSEHQVGVFEMGMNRRGEIFEIASVLNPSLALITNIGTAHIGILGTQDAIAEEKKAVFSNFSSDSVGFIPEDDGYANFLSAIPQGRVELFGFQTTPGFQGFRDNGIDGCIIRYEGLDISFPLPGIYNLKNALGAISLSRYAGVSPKDIQKGLEQVKPLFGRAEIYHGDVTVMLDCYNANPDSMESAVSFCRDVSWSGRKVFVLGSMLELGEDSFKEHRKICSLVSQSGIDSVYFFGSEIIAAAQSVEWSNISCVCCSSIDDLSAALAQDIRFGDLVLIKGSRGMELERVFPVIMHQHKTEPVDE